MAVYKERVYIYKVIQGVYYTIYYMNEKRFINVNIILNSIPVFGWLVSVRI